MTTPRKLLVLDVDETLVHTALKVLDRLPDFTLFGGAYNVYRRPHLTEFLLAVRQVYDLAIWSAGSADYVDQVLQEILPDQVKPVFVWTREHCTRRYDCPLDGGEGSQPDEYFVKRLAKLKRKGFDLQNVLIVDNDRRTARHNYGNLVHVRDFEGAAGDSELPLLARYLVSLNSCLNFRAVEKRYWRQSVSPINQD